MMLRYYVWQQKWVHHRLVIFVEGVKVSIWRHVTTVERRAAVMGTERGLGIVQSYILTETISSQSWLRWFLGKSRKMLTNLRLALTHNCCLKSWARYYRSKKLFFISQFQNVASNNFNHDLSFSHSVVNQSVSQAATQLATQSVSHLAS